MPRTGLSLEQLRELARDGADAALRRLRAEIIASGLSLNWRCQELERCYENRLRPPASGHVGCQRQRGRRFHSE